MNRRLRRRYLRLAVFLVDVCAVLFATLLATQIRWGTLTSDISFESSARTAPYLLLAAVLCIVWLLLFWWERMYDLNRIFWGSEEYTRAIRAVSLGVVVIILVTYSLKLHGFARGWTLLAWILGVVAVCAGRAAMRLTVSRARRRGRLLRPTLLVGSNAEARHIKMRLLKDASSGLALVGYLAGQDSSEGSDQIRGYLECLGESADLERVVPERAIDTVIIAVSAFSDEGVARMIASIRLLEVDVYLSAGLLEVTTSRVMVREASGVPFVVVKGVSLSRTNLYIKRVFDLLVAGAVVLVGIPLWAILGVAVKLSGPGPVFFMQPRTGRDGREFKMFKFRSMSADAPELHAKLASEQNEADGPIFKMKDDPRVTSVGRLMRKYSLDEFPQLLNVLKGEMSLVGPRPLPTYETKDLTLAQRRRHDVPPGLTGMWQVSGRSGLTFDEMIQLDLYYIENWSVVLDMSLLVRTVPVVLLPEGAY
ncbi:MAG: sugar transferase [Coriobacteriia bacterium]|nr:sugar transferase [Coriobacteriia bacterium]